MRNIAGRCSKKGKRGVSDMSSRKEIVERELQVKVPAQYEAFLEKYGIYDVGPIEVCGIREDLLGYDGIPCVIGATQIYRRDEGLPHRFLVIHNTGIEDEYVCLDTVNERVYAFSIDFGDREIANSFDDWFERDILEYQKERDRRSKQSCSEREEIIDLDWMRSNRGDS